MKPARRRYMLSGALTPSSARPFFSVWPTARSNASRAVASAGSPACKTGCLA